METNIDKKSALASYFRVGLGVGAVAGILFAPKAGPETRDQLTRKVQEAKDYAQRKALELQARAEDLMETGRQASENIVAAFHEGRKAYQREMSRTHWR